MERGGNAEGAWNLIVYGRPRRNFVIVRRGPQGIWGKNVKYSLEEAADVKIDPIFVVFKHKFEEHVGNVVISNKI